MKTKVLLIQFFIFLSFLKCQEYKNTNEIHNNIAMTKSILIKQLKAGSNSEYWDTNQYGEQDLKTLLIVENNFLQCNGYKTIPKEHFKERISSIFRRIIDYNSGNPYLKIDIDSKCDRSLEYIPIYYGNNLFYASKEFKFISLFYALPDIIDYKKLYPETTVHEEKPLIFTPYNEDENEIEVPRWKDIKDLPEQRRFNKQLLISRNKYLFNEDQSQFPWLITHDEFFMESLVKTFGYTEDERLLEWVVNRTLNSTEDEEYNKIFFTKDCQGNFILHKNTFSLIQKKISEKYLESIIYNYLKKIDANKDLQSLNFEQKAEVLAYILYTGEAVAQKKFPDFLFRFMGPFYEFNKEREQYNQEFKRKNYYNLPNFKEYWEQAMIDGDGIGIPM